jgi:hypothetical protein
LVDELNGRGDLNIRKRKKKKKGFNKVRPKERDHLEEQRKCGRIRGHWNIKKLDVTVWGGLTRHSIWINDSCTEQSDEKTRSVLIRGFPD